jgi:hypothetical protein
MSSFEVKKENLLTLLGELLKNKDNKIRILGFSILIIWAAFYFCYPSNVESKSVSESIKKKSPKGSSKINKNTDQITTFESPSQSKPQSPIPEAKPTKLFNTPSIGVDTPIGDDTHDKNLSATNSVPTKKTPIKVGVDLNEFINSLRNPGFNVIRIKDSEEMGKILRLNSSGELFFFHGGVSGLMNKISPLKNKKLHVWPIKYLNDVIDANEEPLSFILEFKDLKPIHIGGENNEETIYMKNGLKLLINKVKVDPSFGMN